MERMRAQAQRFGVEVVEGDVTRVEFGRRPFALFAGEHRYHARAVILATGASARWLGLDSETRLRGRGVSACAVCDGFFFRDQEVAIVGGGDTALQEALHLTRFARKVTVIHRRDALRASKILQDRARSEPKIQWMLGNQVAEVLGQERVEGVRLLATRTGALEVLPVQGLFVAIGHRPNTGPFKGQVDLDTDGYVIAKRHTETSVPGVFVAGDVRDRRYRQAITAAGEGAMAALDAEEFLTSENRADWATALASEEGVGTHEGALQAVQDTDMALTAGPAERAPKIIMYTTSWCPYCRKAKRYLAERGLPYEEIDIEQTPGAAEQVERWSDGYRTVPTFDIDGQIVVGFDLAALDRALASIAAKAALVEA